MSRYSIIASLLVLAACPPWYDEDLAAIDERVAYRSLTVGGPTCALTDDGRPYCWGPGGDLLGSVRPTDQCSHYHPSGMPVPPTLCSLRPVPVFTEERFEKIVAATDHVCAISDEGALWCWGANIDGALAQPPSVVKSVGSPREIEGLSEVGSVAVSPGLSCAVTRSGELWCWGRPGPVTAGGSGFPSASDWIAPFRIGGSSPYVEAAIGSEHGCALTEAGEVECWGRSSAFASAIPDGPPCVQDRDGICPSPVRLGIAAPLRSIIAFGSDTCGLAEPDGAVWCWGVAEAPHAVLSGAKAISFCLGGVCAVDGEGAAMCHETFLPCGGASWPKLESIAGSYTTACGLAPEGDVYCWGSNDDGNFGSGDQGSSEIPVKTSDPYEY